MRRTRTFGAALAVALAVSGFGGASFAQDAAPAETPSAEANAPKPPPAAGEDDPLDLSEYLRTGGRKKGDALKAALDKAAGFPLGSKENPVRVNMPAGQHAYLRRLRCSNDRAPKFERVGNFGPGVFGSIIDGYTVVCPGDGEPKQSMVFMDMYHADHDEKAAPPGFTIKP